MIGLAVLAPACGEAGDGAAGEPGDREPAAELEIVLRPDGASGRELRASLTCDPVGGTHPDPVAACRALEASADALEPVPSDAVCTQVFGGPEQAEVTGRWRGRDVRARFNRANGCEIARWDRLAALLRLDRAP